MYSFFMIVFFDELNIEIVFCFFEIVQCSVMVGFSYKCLSIQLNLNLNG